MSWLSEWLHPEPGIQANIDKTQGYYNRAQDVEKKYFDPYIQRGQQAGDVLSGQYGQMAQDPGAMLSKMMDGYEPSPFYQTMQDRMGQAASNTAAAGGMRGSPAEQSQQQELTQALMSKDMQQYLQNVMGLQGQGLQGEQNLYGIGAQAGMGLGSDLANILGTQGGVQFQGGRQMQQAKNDRMSGIMKAIGMFAGSPTGKAAMDWSTAGFGGV